MKRILMATDVPFWRAKTGAQQRMASMARFLVGAGHEIRVFYLGDHASEDAILIEELGINVRRETSEEIPQGFFDAAVWYAGATFYTIRNSLGMIDRSTLDEKPTLRLKDFDWPWARKRFAKVAESFNPDVVIAEYIKMGYLVDALPKKLRMAMHCLIDTHDLLYRRNEQFRESGFRHWLDVSREEEAGVLRRFDTVIAIQEAEAEEFRVMAPETRVIVCGHSIEPLPELKVTAREERPLKIGFLASQNHANKIALERLISLKPMLPDVQFVIAGSVCELISSDDQPGSDERFKQLGVVEALRDFYDQVDVVVNLVEFGSGLKIKTIEALSFGKPVITTEHGVEGLGRLQSDLRDVVIESKTMEFCCSKLKRLQDDRLELERLQHLAYKLAAREFCDSSVFADLERCVNSTSLTDHS